MIYSAEMNIGLLMLIIWVVLSWLGSSKKQKRAHREGGIRPPLRPSGISQMLRDLGKQFEESRAHEGAFMSTEDINETPQTKPLPAQPVPITPKPVKPVRRDIAENRHHPADLKFTMDAHYAQKQAEMMATELLDDLKDAGILQKAILFKEIIGKPRALQPYHPSVMRD